MEQRTSAEPMEPDWLLSQLPDDIVDTFSAEQRAALWTASRAPTWRRYPVNIRWAFGAFGRRYFLTVVGGVDRRNDERRARESRLHPFRTASNLLFLAIAGVVFFTGAFFLLALVSALVEF